MTQKPLILAVETSSRIGSVAIAIGEKILAETTFSAPLRHSAEIFPAIDNILKRFSRKPDQIEQVHISIGPGSFTGLRIAVTLAKTMHLTNNAKIVTADTLDVIAANTIQTSNLEPRTTSHEKIATISDAKRGQFFIAVYQLLHKNTPSFPRKLVLDPDRGQESTSVIRNTQACPERSRRGQIRDMSNGIWQKVWPDSIMTASQFLVKFAHGEKPIYLLGDGLLYYKDKFKADGVHFFDEKFWSPQASNVHLLGWKKALAGQFADPLTLTPNYLIRPDIKIKTR